MYSVLDTIVILFSLDVSQTSLCLGTKSRLIVDTRKLNLSSEIGAHISWEHMVSLKLAVVSKH
jgi:hypothetical protein